MAENGVYNRARQCDGKLAYRTKKFAKRIAVTSMSAMGPADGRVNPRKAEAYRCPWCGFWHVGHSATAAADGDVHDMAFVVGRVVTAPLRSSHHAGRPTGRARFDLRVTDGTVTDRHTLTVNCGPAVADRIVGTVAPGDHVVVLGELHETAWRTPEGEERTRSTFRARSVEVCAGPTGDVA